MDKESIHEIRDVMLSVLDEFFKKLNRDKTYTVNQIAKRLGVSHATITKQLQTLKSDGSGGYLLLGRSAGSVIGYIQRDIISSRLRRDCFLVLSLNVQ